MLGNALCWGVALALMFTEAEGLAHDYKRLLFAMGFIFLGILSKAVSVYRDTHTIEIDVTEDENGKLVLDKK